MSKDIENIMDQIKKLTIWSDKQYSGNSYWKELDIANRIYSDNLCKIPTKTDIRKAVKEYYNDINQAKKPRNYIKTNGREFFYWDVKSINEHLVPEGYFYDYEQCEYDKETYLLGKILDYRKINGRDEIIVEELICNQGINNPGYVNIPDKLTIGKSKSSEIMLWDKIYNLRNNVLDDKKRLLEKGLMLLGFTEKELFEAEPEKININVKKISKKSLETVLKHENGHIAAQKYLSYKNFIKGLKIANSMELEDWIRAVDDSLADTIETKEIKGRFPFIIKEKKDRDGLLFLGSYETLEDENLKKLEYDMVLALPEYKTTGDIQVLKEANEKIFNRGCELADMINHIIIKNKNPWRKFFDIKKEADKQYKKKESKIRRALKDLASL